VARKICPEKCIGSRRNDTITKVKNTTMIRIPGGRECPAHTGTAEG